MNHALNILMVALGGAVGASLRYLLTLWSAAVFGPGFPVGVMTANVLGSGVMGLLAGTLLDRAGPLGLFLMTGLLGGFTTFSAYALDALTLYERGRVGAAAGYVLGSVALSLAAVVAGAALARLLGGR